MEENNNVNENSKPITIKIGLVDLLLIFMAVLSISLAVLYFIIH